MKRSAFCLCAILVIFQFPGLALGQSDVSKRRKAFPLPALRVVSARPADDDLRRLLIERYTAVASDLIATTELFREVIGDTNDLVEASRRVLSAIVDLAETAEEKLVLLEPLRVFTKSIEDYADFRGFVTHKHTVWLSRAAALRLEVDIEILRAKKLVKAAK